MTLLIGLTNPALASSVYLSCVQNNTSLIVQSLTGCSIAVSFSTSSSLVGWSSLTMALVSLVAVSLTSCCCSGVRMVSISSLISLFSLVAVASLLFRSSGLPHLASLPWVAVVVLLLFRSSGGLSSLPVSSPLNHSAKVIAISPIFDRSDGGFSASALAGSSLVAGPQPSSHPPFGVRPCCSCPGFSCLIYILSLSQYYQYNNTSNLPS